MLKGWDRAGGGSAGQGCFCIGKRGLSSSHCGTVCTPAHLLPAPARLCRWYMEKYVIPHAVKIAVLLCSGSVRKPNMFSTYNPNFQACSGLFLEETLTKIDVPRSNLVRYCSIMGEHLS